MNNKKHLDIYWKEMQKKKIIYYIVLRQVLDFMEICEALNMSFLEVRYFKTM